METGRTGKIILTEEEWTRINGYLLTLEKLKKGEPKVNNEGRMKPKVLLTGRSRNTFQYGGTLKEQRKKTESLPEMGTMGKTPLSDKTKEEIIIRAKKLLFENKDYARRLLHGLKLSSVLHERNQQLEFTRRLRNMLDVLEAEMKRKAREEAKKCEEEIMRDKMRRRENNEKLRNELDKQIREKMEIRRMEELEKAREGKEIIKMNEELKMMLKKEREEVEEKKEKLKEDIENYTKSEEDIRTRLRIKEKEEEEVNKIYQKVAWELDNKRRDKEKVRMRKVDKNMFKDVKEPMKMHSDGDKKLKSFLLMREARKRALLNDLLTSMETAKEEMERRRNEEESERRKCIAQRYRIEEANRLRNLKEKEERRKLMNNTRKYYIMQWMEKKQMEREEKELDRFYAPDFSEENKMIGEYCDEVLGLVKKNRRPVFPVAAAVKDVKKEFGLEPVRNLNFLKSNVPIGK